MSKHIVYADIETKYIALNINYDVIEYKHGFVLRNAHTRDIIGEYTNLRDVFKSVEGHSKDWTSDMIKLEDKSNGVVFNFEGGLKGVYLKDPNKTLEDIENLYNIEILSTGNYYEEPTKDSRGNQRIVRFDNTGREEFILVRTDKTTKSLVEKGASQLRRELFYYREVSRNTGLRVIYHNIKDGYSILLDKGVVSAVVCKHYIAQTKAEDMVGKAHYKVDSLFWLKEQMVRLPNNWGENYN